MYTLDLQTCGRIKEKKKKRAEHEHSNVPDPAVNYALHIGLTQIHSNEKSVYGTHSVRLSPVLIFDTRAKCKLSTIAIQTATSTKKNQKKTFNLF